MEKTLEVPLKEGECALLVIDVQKYFCFPGSGYFKDSMPIDPNSMSDTERGYFDRLNNTVIPTISKLLKAFRKTKSEIIHTYIECRTQDGRDQSFEYKALNMLVPKGSPEAAIAEPLAPIGDEIMIPKSSISVFNSTSIEYILRNLGVKQIVMVGLVTHQCVMSAVRDAADKGFLVTLVEDACTAVLQSDHDNALEQVRGIFGRVRTAAQVEAEVLSFQEEK